MSSSDLRAIDLADRQILLLGTAHVSRDSVREVEDAIRTLSPDRVCVELDEKRLKALTEPDAWKKLDLIAVIKQGQLSTLVANLMLASHQKRMGLQTGAKPGAELLAAVQTAQELGIPVDLVDREIKTTLRRAWSLTPWRRRLMLAGSLIESLFDKTPVTEEKLGEMREQDTLSALMDEMGKTFPEIREVVLSERDHFMVGRIRATDGKKVLAVIGAGHRQGMAELLESGKPTTPEEVLNHVPPRSKVWTWVGWGIPVAVVGSMIWLGATKGTSVLGDSLLYWVLVTGLPAAFGALLALAHPLAILTAFVMAPLKPFRPFVSSGTFVALVQAWLMPPRVQEMEAVSEDLSRFGKWWSNRLLRVVLCFFMPSLPATIGMIFGVSHIVKNVAR